MTLSAGRIAKAKYAADAFSGRGTEQDPGRWNSLGVPVVYTAGSQALAVLETLVHLDDGDLLSHYRLIQVAFDDAMVIPGSKMLPADWSRRSSLKVTRAIGDQCAKINRSVVMQVSSAIVPSESNFTALRRLLDETDGNLGAQLHKLEDAGYIAVKKEFNARKPVSWYMLTPAGRRALKQHLSAMEALVRAAKV